MTALHAATLNIRNIADRWSERLPLLLADMAALQPDVIGLQEVVFAAQQDRLLGASGAARYEAFRGWAGRPEYGNAILLREGFVAAEADRLDLGMNRSALWLPITAPDGQAFAFVVTHLHHTVPDEAQREAQAKALLTWLDGKSKPAAQIVVGDFNAEPVEPTYARMVEAGFRSAYAEANGVEPAVTWPSGIQAPGMDTDGEPGCLDYIWIRGPITGRAARLVFDRPAVGDSTLYPSDHIGISAQLEIGT